jgi:hypothetical protein
MANQWKCVCAHTFSFCARFQQHELILSQKQQQAILLCPANEIMRAFHIKEAAAESKFIPWFVDTL